MIGLYALGAVYITFAPVIVELLVHLTPSLPELPAKISRKRRDRRDIGCKPCHAITSEVS